MPRGKPVRRGRGRGRGGASAAPPRNSRYLVAKPSVKDLPDNLVLTPTAELVPPVLVDALAEFRGAQSFFSSLERIYPEFAGSVDGYHRCWLGTKSGNISGFVRDSSSNFKGSIVLRDSDEKTTEKPVFVKRIHLLDPLSAMEGEYVWPRDGALPAPSEPWRNALTKINDPLNEAYVDALFASIASKLVETGTSPHWCHTYGTFSARVDKYLFNITDEYNSIRRKPWWRRNQRLGLFKVYDPNNDGTESNDLVFSAADGKLDSEDFETLGDDLLEADTASSVEEAEPELSNDSSVQLSTPKLRLSRISGSASEESGENETCEIDSEDDEVMYAEFHDFPVQVTLLEHAQGTMDELLDDEEDDPSLADTRDERWAAWLWQVISALTTAQHLYGFVHNDLHTNNIMWNTTDQDYLYYRIHKGNSSWIMKVPTFGRIMKIIDFGRASFTLPEPGGFFISDAFYPGNDAGQQYNCEPFYDAEDGPRVEPNPSFDLCRLAVSLLESLYPERPDAVKPVKPMSREGAKIYTETVSPVYNMLWSWLQDDNGMNVLRKPGGDERYPDFDLYKAIAADVHNSVPCRQLERPLFSKYRTESTPTDTIIYDLFIN
jgi:hypothetical protein